VRARDAAYGSPNARSARHGQTLATQHGPKDRGSHVREGPPRLRVRLILLALHSLLGAGQAVLQRACARGELCLQRLRLRIALLTREELQAGAERTFALIRFGRDVERRAPVERERLRTAQPPSVRFLP